MTETEVEGLLRSALNARAEGAPYIDTSLTEATKSAKWKVLAPIGGVAAAAVVVLGFALFTPGTHDGDGVAPAASGYGAVANLTGKDVGDALGLKPETGVVTGCDLGAEYENGSSFCLDGVTDDPVEAEVLALQITGYRRTDLLVDYARANLAAHQASNENPDSVQTMELMQNAQSLYGQLVQQQPDATGGKS